MTRLCALALGAWCLIGPLPAQAQLFNLFRKSPPPVPPAQRVVQLITAVRSETDERKRTEAVEELRNFDTKAYPEIVPVLVDAAKSDPKASVRAEAVNSLVRIRPVSVIAGQAIDHAANHDESWWNRRSAQAALMRYRLAGYSPPPAPLPPPATAKAAPNAKTSTPAVAPNLPPQSQEPPLAEAPDVLYFDQNGRPIPAPKNLQGPIVPAPGRTPTATIPSNPGLLSQPASRPTSAAPPVSPPAPPIVTAPSLPPEGAEPPALVSPAPNQPEVSEPTFRSMNKIGRTAPPSAPVLIDSAPSLLSPMPTIQGPSLDLPPPPTLTPAAPAAPRPERAPLTPAPMPTSGPAPF